MGFILKPIVFTSSSQFVNPADLLFVDIQDWDERKREGVKVRVGVSVAGVLSKDKTLEVATTLIFFIKTTVGPGFDDDFVVVWDIQVLDCLLEVGIGFADIDQDVEFLAVGVLAICGVRLWDSTRTLTESKRLDVPCQ